MWPPQDAVPVGTEDRYDILAAGGMEYGPAFRGLRAAWRRGRDVFATVALPDEVAGSAGSFGVHPALLDAALHAAGLAEETGPAGEPGAKPGQVWLPFAYAGVSVHAAGASVLRVRLRLDQAGLSLVAADGAGAPVVSVGSLVSRPVTPGQLEAGGDLRDALFAVEWAAVPVPAGPWRGAGCWWVRTGWDWRVPGRGCTRTWRRWPGRSRRVSSRSRRRCWRVPGRWPPTGPARRPWTVRGPGGRRRAGCWGWCSGGWPRSGWRGRGWCW